MSPTKALATEIITLLESLGGAIGVKCCACVGGTKVVDDQRLLGARPHVVCGTPGRISDLINRRFLQTQHIKVLALGGTGKLLERDFRADMHKVHAALPEGVQIIRGSMAPPPRRRR